MRLVFYNTRTRERNRKPDIRVRLIATDDYGDMALALCHLTGRVFDAQKGVVRGSLIPQASSAFLDADNSDIEHKVSIRAFHEMDRNCNTCQFLSRIKHQKNIDGMLHGHCLSADRTEHPYPVDGNEIAFHPDDCMSMDCWLPRP